MQAERTQPNRAKPCKRRFILLTWQLWAALRYPYAEYPVFRRLQHQPIAIPGARYLRRVQTLFDLTPLLMTGLSAFVIVFIILAISNVFTSPIILVVPLMLIVAANGYGALVAFNIMNTIKTEQQQGTYDLLGVAPTGLLGANWAIATGRVWRLQVLERLATVRTLISVLVVMLSVIISQNGAFTPLLGVGVVLALNFDTIQTVISGCLSGILAQELGESGSPFIALALFAFVQIIVVYLPVTLVVIALFVAFRSAASSMLLADALLSVVLIALPFSIREILFRLMQRELERRLV